MNHFPWTLCLVPLYCVKKGGRFSLNSSGSSEYRKFSYNSLSHSWNCAFGRGAIFLKSSEIVYARYDQLKHSSHE